MHAALLPAAVVTITLGSGGAEGIAPPAPLVSELRQRLAAEVSRLKAQLSALEADADYTLLLERKLTVDASLTPLLLQEDAAAFVAAVEAGREPPDVLRLLRAEYGPTPQRSRWSCRDGPARVAKALAAWAAPADGIAACMATSAALVAPDDESAAFICWTARIQASPSAPMVRADACWYEPCLETRRLDWPLSPMNLAVAWDAVGGQIAAGAGAEHAEVWPARPVFNNPQDIYSLFDALRARNCIDLGLIAETPVEAAGGAAEAPDLVTRTLTRSDSSTVRVEAWRFEDGRLVALEISQPTLQLVHASPQAYEIRREVQGQSVAEPEELRPQSVLAYPPAGMKIAVSFRAPDPTRDALDPEQMFDSATTVPDEILVSTAAGPLARAVVAGIASGSGELGAARVERALRGWQMAAASGAAMRAQAMSQAESACAAGNLESVRAALAQAIRLLEADGVPPSWATANIEVCIRRLEDAGFAGRAGELASLDWLASLSAADPARRRYAATRAVRGGSAALRATATGPLAVQDDAVNRAVDEALVERARRLQAVGGLLTECAPPCEAAGVPPYREPVYEAIRETLAATPRWIPAMTPGLAAALVRSACRVLAETAATDAVASARLSQTAASDLRAVFQYGVGELSPAMLADSSNGCAVCAQFSQRLTRALKLVPPDEAERAALLQSVRTFADATRTVALGVAQDHGLHPDEAGEVARNAAASVRRLESLVGNAFEPVLLRLPSTPLPPQHALVQEIRSSVELRVALQVLDHELSTRAAANIMVPVAGDKGLSETRGSKSQERNARERLCNRLADAVAAAGLGAVHQWQGRPTPAVAALEGGTP